jgi:HEAT repeat protein
MNIKSKNIIVWALLMISFLLVSHFAIAFISGQNLQTSPSIPSDLRTKVVALVEEATNPNKQQAVCQKLDGIGTPAIDVLMELTLDEKLGPVSMQLLRSLGPGAVPYLIKTLNSGKKPFNVKAAEALSGIVDSRKYEPLFSALDSTDASLIHAALQAIAQSSWPADLWNSQRLELLAKLTRDDSLEISSLAAMTVLRSCEPGAYDYVADSLPDLINRLGDAENLRDINSGLPAFIHADNLRLVQLLENQQIFDKYAGSSFKDLLRQIRLHYPGLSTNELDAGLKELQSDRSFSLNDPRQPFLQRLTDDPRQELTASIAAAADTMLAGSDREPLGDVLKALTVLSPMKAASLGTELLARYPVSASNGLPEAFEQPEAISVMAGHLKSQNDSVEWFQTAKAVAFLSRNRSETETRSFLESQQLPEIKIAAVMYALNLPNNEIFPSAQRFPLGVPTDYMMLSVVGSGRSQPYSLIAKLARDRLYTSSALAKALQKNPAGAISVLSGHSFQSDSEAFACFVWALVRIPGDQSTEMLRNLLKDSNTYIPVIIRELGMRRDLQSVPMLLKELNSGNSLISAAAARALGRMRVLEAAPLLREDLKHADNFTKRDMAEAIILIEGASAALGLFRQSGSWGIVSRDYLLRPLVDSGGEGENLVLSQFMGSAPKDPKALSAARALIESGRLSAMLCLVEAIDRRQDLSGLDAFSFGSHILPELADRVQLPEAIAPFIRLAAHKDMNTSVVEGLVRRPGPIPDQIVMGALRRGADPWRFREYFSKRSLPEAVPIILAAYMEGGRKSGSFETFIKTGAPDAISLIRELLSKTGDAASGSGAFKDAIEALYETPAQEGWDLLPAMYPRLTDRDRFDAINRIPRRRSQPGIASYLVSLLGTPAIQTKERTLGTDTLDFSAAAAAALERLDAETAIPDVFRHWDRPEVRTKSLMLLARHPGKETVPRILEMVRNRDYRAWRQIEIALALASSPEKLAALAVDPDPVVRRKAAAVLGQLHGKTADNALRRFAVDKDSNVRATAIASMDRGPASKFSRTVLNALNDPNEIVRREAVRTSGLLHNPDAIPSLISILDSGTQLSESAANALGRIGGKQAEQALLNATGRIPANCAAVRQLGQLAVDAAVPSLARSVNSNEINVRHAALQALAMIASPDAINALLDADTHSGSFVHNHPEWKRIQQPSPEQQTAAKQPQQESSKDLLKKPSAHFPTQKDLFARSFPLDFAGKEAFHYSYFRTQKGDYIAWSKFEQGPSALEESWPLSLSRSTDQGLTWLPPEQLFVSKADLSHFQPIFARDGQTRVVFARGREIYVGSWDSNKTYSEKAVVVGAENSETVMFNVLERKDGTYLLFAAVGTSLPNESLRDRSELVMVQSNDLETWSPPVSIGLIEEGLGYFTVDSIPAAELKDGSVLVGVGTKLYRSRIWPIAWDTVWQASDEDLIGYRDGISCLLVGRDGRIHLGYRSQRYGFNDLFLTSTTDFKTWSQPLCTMIHDSVGSATSMEPGPQFLLEEPDGTISVVHYLADESFGAEGLLPGRVTRSIPDPAALLKDSDGDGLPDCIEARFLTDPLNADTDGDGIPDSKDLNPLAPRRLSSERDRIRQAALERLNYWHERKPDMSEPAPMMIVVTDGEERQEFQGYPGVILNLSPKERNEFWSRFGRFGISSEEVIITSFKDGDKQATVHTFTGHEAFSVTLVKLGDSWVATEVTATFRVY